MELLDLLAALPGYEIVSARSSSTPPIAPIEITKITPDSRQVEPGTLFVAYQGVSVDGHRFIPQARAAGAAAVVSEVNTDVPPGSPPLILVPNSREALAYLAAAWQDFPARRLRMIGTTGTDGKTTTTHFLYHMLKAAGQNVGMINTVSAIIGHEVLETGLHTTTPDPLDVQRYLRQMVEAGLESCLLEVTSHGLAHHRVTGCDFDIAIVTNITHEHLDLHGSLDAYRAAKAMLFESLATATTKGYPKMAVLNCDDWSFTYLKEKLAPLGVPWLGYSLLDHPQATIIAQDIVYRPAKTRFTIHHKRGNRETFTVETTLVGDYNVSNCLAATTAALAVMDIPPDAIQRGVTALQDIPGRMERLDEGQPFLAMVDFAHTPNALRRALTVTKTLTPGRVIAVFGCAGLRDVEKRTMMGHIAAELADVTIITAEDPRTENLDDIIAQTAETMLADGAVEGQTFERVPDRGRAIYRATQLAQPGDVVITLGKGHEQSMCFGTVEYPWDDRQALRSALRGQPLLTLPTAQAN